ncbi:MAG: hypothetical protein KDA29_12650 [Phycisphaerales bacterium]|nr:hypothetical protein [Phycisphaerales bacterium]
MPVNTRNIGLILTLVSTFTVDAFGQETLFTQGPVSGGGVMRASSLWVDPSDQNDSDNDSIAWENFELPGMSEITRLRWWGQSLPPLGFNVSFYNQDPNTIAVQPDIFGADPSGAFAEYDFPTPSVQSAGGIYQFTVDLPTPLVLEGNTRYFISVVGLTPIFSGSWSWAQSLANNLGTFWWVRGAHMYFHLGDDRAVELIGNCFDCAAPCPADLDENGTLDFFDVSAFLSAYQLQQPAADFSGDGLFNFFDVSSFLGAFSAGCP